MNSYYQFKDHWLICINLICITYKSGKLWILFLSNLVIHYIVAGDAIEDMLGAAVSEIAGRAKQAFIVGNGLSKEGVRLLGKKLACMTIGDLEALLDFKNIDPEKVAELMKNIANLAKALVRYKPSWSKSLSEHLWLKIVWCHSSSSLYLNTLKPQGKVQQNFAQIP